MDVLKLLLKLMVFKLEKSENIFKQSVGAKIGASLTIYKLYKLCSELFESFNPLSIR